MKSPSVRRGERGFTLIELLVVIIIIGILAAVAVPQYFKVVERGRVVESQSFMGSIKSAQERYLARYGKYSNDLSKLDIGLTTGCSTSEHECGMKFFRFVSCTTSSPVSGPEYILKVQRCKGQSTCSAEPPATYNDYTLTYTRSTDKTDYGSCTACENDF